MRLRGGLRVLRRSATEVQVGTDPRWAVRADRPDAAAEADAPAPVDADDRTVGRARRPPRADPAACATSSTQLDDAQLTDAGRRRPAAAARPCDAQRLVAAAPGTPTAPTWSRARARRVVGGARARADRPGRSPSALAAAGVGTVLLDDTRPVRSGRRRTERLPLDRRRRVARRGRRAAAARRRTAGVDGRRARARRAWCSSRPTSPTPTARPSLRRRGRRRTCRSSCGRRTPSSVRSSSPGDGPCLRCLDLHRADADPAWPALAGSAAADRAPAGRGRRHVAGVAAGARRRRRARAPRRRRPRTRAGHFEIAACRTRSPADARGRCTPTAGAPPCRPSLRQRVRPLGRPSGRRRPRSCGAGHDRAWSRRPRRR